MQAHDRVQGAAGGWQTQTQIPAVLQASTDTDHGHGQRLTDTDNGRGPRSLRPVARHPRQRTR